MAIVFGDNGENSINLLVDPTRSYGQENDRVAGLGGSDAILTGAGNDFLDGGLGIIS